MDEPRVRVFDYVPEFDAFRVTPEFAALADELGLIEWSPVVWVGRLFIMDNDLGEHWFDNWDQRQAAEERAKELGIPLDSEDLLFVVPERFADGRDGPCHPPEMRKRFWTDVLKSLELSLELMLEEARRFNEQRREFPTEACDPMLDLEPRIDAIRARYRHG